MLRESPWTVRKNGGALKCKNNNKLNEMFTKILMNHESNTFSPKNLNVTQPKWNTKLMIEI